MRFALIAVVLLTPSLARAGLHYRAEVWAELPARWGGYLPDHRTLRLLPLARSPWHAGYAAERDRLAALPSPTADDLADLGAVHLRLGEAERAVEVLRDAQRRFPDDFRIAANLGTAWQQSGDLAQAAAALERAVVLASPRWRKAEELHLRLVRSRLKEPRGTGPDDLFGVRYGGPGEAADVPADALALVQQLAMWLPADGRLLWQAGELANAAGEVRTAANVFDGCVTEFNIADPASRRRRQEFRAAADSLLPTKAGHDGAAFRSERPFKTRPVALKLPPVRKGGLNTLPWPVLGETTFDRNSRPQFAAHLKQLDGERVTLNGYLQPPGGDTESAFLLLEYPIGCWFCEVPGPTGLILVELPAGKSMKLTKDLVRIEGVLKLNATDPEDYFFSIRDARIDAPD